MLSQIIFSDSTPSVREAIVTLNSAMTWGQLKRVASSICREHKLLSMRRIGLSFQPRAESYAVLAALDKLKCDVFLLDGNLSSPRIAELGRAFKLAAVLEPESNGESVRVLVNGFSGEYAWSGHSTVTILTSGSTGEAKAARHTWDILCRPVRKADGMSAPRWFLTYRPNLYAGLQVMLQCFVNYGTLVMPGSEHNPQLDAELMFAGGVRFVSGTPSYYRQLLMFADRELMQRIDLEQINLGGEVVDQSLLDRLKQFFPRARHVHIYATTELGRCFSVTDGLAGFPAKYLERPSPDGVEMKIHEGELLVRSANAMQCYDVCSPRYTTEGEWHATGDMVELKGDRAYFVGRKSEMINVAGSKVYPIEVEQVIRAIAGVSDVRVFGRASSITGQVVACEIVAKEGLDPMVLRETVARISMSKLPSYQRPRQINVVKQIAVSAAGKTLRGVS